ncbi:aminotransferase class V-fold PLP-dependent enzyme [Thiorhodococcus minor]|uniref:Aminotransferase class V-fold PLP-dependent enzyme n=1 Tax=Thiorhodococcus minor TaxID=57489 RepID=A0A6M0JY60_9GAMM|nr:aminotransferase class V-fold PLP-dependent enzyme [Thiorhodococcus minor]
MAVKSNTRNAQHSNSALDRRSFLKLAGATAVGVATLTGPMAAIAGGQGRSTLNIQPGWSDDKVFKEVRKLFLLDRHATYMNIGTTGSMPKPVLDSYDTYNRIVATSPWDMQGEWGAWPYTGDLVARIAPQFGCNASELVMTRNTTDGMVSVLHGLDLREGDHVIATHHEHVAATSPLWVLADRLGVQVEYVSIPVFPGSEDDYLAAIEAAIRPETRLIVMSHVTYKTGAVLPVARICDDVAVPNGIPTLIDGAHGSGMLSLDLHAIDCDFYAASGHKWQCGPGGTGLLYVRDGAARRAEFWPERKPMWAVNSSLAHYVDRFGWQTALQYKGNDNYPALRALADVCDLWGSIGRDRIESWDKDLSQLTRDLIREQLPDAVLYTPDIRELTGGITAFNPFTDQADLSTLTQFRDRLREEYGYIVRTTDFELTSGGEAVHALRISTHLFHDQGDVEGLVDAMRDLFERMV